MKPTAALLEDLRAFGLTYPGTSRASPWPEHDDLRVKDKTFAFMGAAGQPFSLSLKLPYSGPEALDLPYAKPTGYGMGKSGWVSLSPGPDDDLPPMDKLKSWLDESYRAQAPKSLIKQLG
jgi:predicted DNA-binding protein (MmcQ/YjbR family)